MAIILNKKDKPKLVVREVPLAMPDSPLLSTGIDVTTIPQGHLCCWKCHKHLFECWVYGDNHRVEMGCMECNQSYRLLFPLTVSMPPKQGRFTCSKHPTKGMICIHANNTICIGCESCKSEIRFLLKEEGLIIPS